jgi:hypothetical protein
VPKKIKTATKDTGQPSGPPIPQADAPIEPESTRRPPAKAKKPAAKKATKRSARKGTISALGSPMHPTDEDIRLRAYFISERRHRFALPGDATSDWEEARRQLVSEFGPR